MKSEKAFFTEVKREKMSCEFHCQIIRTDEKP